MVKALALALLVLPLAGAADAGRLSPVGPMTVARAVHTATTLADGRVLVVGGCTTQGASSAATRAASRSCTTRAVRRFEQTGSLNEWRDNHTATSFCGTGECWWSAAGASAACFIRASSSTRAWERCDRAEDGSPRAGSTATLLRDGRVLLREASPTTGRRSRPRTSSCRQDRFLPVGPMAVPRGAHAAARLADGRVLVVGGLSRGRVVASSELFDPRTDGSRAARRAPPGKRRPRWCSATAASLSSAARRNRSRVKRTYRSTGENLTSRSGTARPRAGALLHARYKIRDAVVVLPGGDVLVAGAAPVPEVWRSGGRSSPSRARWTETPLRDREPCAPARSC